MAKIIENRPNTVVISAKNRAEARRFARNKPDLNISGMTSIPKKFHANFYGVKAGKVYIIDKKRR